MIRPWKILEKIQKCSCQSYFLNCGVLSVFREKTTPLRYTRVSFWSGSCRQFPGRPILSGDVVLSLSDCVREIFRPVSQQRRGSGTGRGIVPIPSLKKPEPAELSS